MTAIRFRPDGRRVIRASDDGTVPVWTLDLDELVEIAGRRVTRSMTDEEFQQYLHVDSCGSASREGFRLAGTNNVMNTSASRLRWARPWPRQA